MSLDPPEGERSFEAEVCHLLAVITDLLLEPRPDWDTLDRLQYALDPFTPYPPEPPAADVDRFEPTPITEAEFVDIHRALLRPPLIPESQSVTWTETSNPSEYTFTHHRKS